MKATLIAAMLAMFAATASAETSTKPLAANDSLSKQFAALDAEPKGHDLITPCVSQCAERRAYTSSRQTLILGIAY